MANPQYLNQAIQMCNNALRHQQFLTPRQKRTFRRFIQEAESGIEITDKQMKRILRHIHKAHISLTHKVGGPV